MASDPKNEAKKLGKKLLSKLMDSFDSKGDVPPKPPPKPTQSSSASGPSTAPTPWSQDPLPTFDNLTISSPSSHHTSHGTFVGGFHPRLPEFSEGLHHNYAASTSNRPSLPMPTPFAGYPTQSLTMQMALRPPDASPLTRPHSNPNPAPFDKLNTAQTGASPTRPPFGRPNSSPITPSKPQKTEAASTVSTPGKSGGVQCAGITKAGKQCTRIVKTKAGIAVDSDDEDSSTQVFCHQHSKELMEPSGYYARKNGEWVKFEDWIPPYLQEETQVALRIEMEKSKTQSDVPGYIYTFEIRDDQEHTIKLKVGRAVNIVKRLDQWGKQCGSKEQVLRGYYPGNHGEDASLMKGRVKMGEKGPWCHRLERLIHLELADLVTHCLYLEPSWPKVEASASAGKHRESRDPSKPCIDCGTVHKEIFEFQRISRGHMKGKEWLEIVKPVIERWGTFVELYV